MTSALFSRRGRVAGVAACVVGIALTSAGCGPHPAASIAMRSTALNLQFARPDLAKPIPPNIIVKLLPLPPVVGPTPVTFPSIPTIVVVPPANSCPPASKKAKPAAPLKASTLAAPAPGFYGYATKGKASVTGGANPVTVPMPFLTQVAISKSSQEAPDTTVAAEGGAPASGKETEYVVTTRFSSNLSEVDVLMVSATSINLVQRTLTDGQRALNFTPTPQVQLVVFGRVGSTWKSSGSDSSSGSVMNYQGSIDGIKQINVCGQLVKGYEISYSYSLANPAVGEIIRTNSNDANTLLVAPQFGGLILGQHVDTDDIQFNATLSGYIQVTLNYDTTLKKLTPVRDASEL